MRNTLSFAITFGFLFSLNTWAMKARVLEVVPGDRPFAKLSNGEVKFLSEKSLLQLGDEVEVNETQNGFSLENSSYISTILETDDNAKDIFNSMRRRPRWRSQCYNRAHVWAYEEFKKSGTKLNKTFIFFTNKYIRNYGYKWWFHVAPSTFVKSGDSKKEMVLDWSFFDGPVETENWTKYFVYSGASCPTVFKYSDYENNQNKEDCYLIKTSMYFWQPLDIEEFEKSGTEKTHFIDYEVRRAYSQAF